MATKPKLSLAIIVKDEAESLKRCVDSVIQYVDEVVVVVNKGNLKKIEGEFTYLPQQRKGTVSDPSLAKLKFFEREWNKNFADARNFSFEKCTGEVILWLDADDTVKGAEKLPQLAQDIIDGKFDWVNLEYQYEFDEYGRCIMTHWKPRLTRAGTGAWVGAIHETFIAHKAVVQVKNEEVSIIHHQEPGHQDRSAIRNLEILLAEFNKDKEKTDPRTVYYLANTLMGMQKFDEAIPFYLQHIKHCGWPEEKYFSMHYLSKCLIWTNQADKAINISLEATKLFPDWSLAYHDIGEAYMHKEDYPRAIQWILTGTTKDKPKATVYFLNDLDYDLYPYARLADAYLQIHNFDEALRLARFLKSRFPTDKNVEDLLKDCLEVKKGEDFVKSFINVAGYIRNKDRLKAVKLFDALPLEADQDVRIQQTRKMIVPPKVWEDKTIAIYCHPGHEEWAYPSIFTGIGGSEEAVIHMSQQLTKLGYKVTVYCKCGTMAGTYQEVEYKPYYHFNQEDQFDTVIIWRYAGFMADGLHAKRKYVWLHDIVHESTFNEKIIKNTDKFLFLSKWHRNNAPSLPEDKVYLTNNGINPKDFLELDVTKKKPYSMIYVSSYDRGAFCLGLDIFPLIKKAIPEAELKIAYGMGNLEKEMDRIPFLKEVYDKMQEVFKIDGITHLGRISHQQIAQLAKESVMHIYPTEFGETNFIGSQKSQAAGAYVLTTTQSGATPERIRFGEAMEGSNIYSDKAFQRRFADRAIELLKNPPVIDEQQRSVIIDEFAWETTAKGWHKDLLG